MNYRSIAVIVVTYNRRIDLMTCLSALVCQSLLPDEIIIINNQSPDDTQEWLYNSGYIDLSSPKQNEFGVEYTKIHTTDSGATIKITYILKNENDGGAGGFYAGMKTAYDKKHEWIILMDDDGRPDSDEIKQLITVSQNKNIKYANALVINRDNHSELAFNLFKTPIHTDYYNNIETICDCGSPFNGTLIHRTLIDSIGFIKKEMYIWGDEAEYTARAKKAGHPITTICSARHYHPKTGKSQNMIPFISRWGILPPSTNRAHIFYRNQCYILSKYGNKKDMAKFIARNLIGAVLNLQWKYIPGMVKAMQRGLSADFSKK